MRKGNLAERKETRDETAGTRVHREDLTEHQASALNGILDWYAGTGPQVASIGGYAGVGKTTTLSCLVCEMLEGGVGVAVIAPTGKATGVARQKLRENGADDFDRSGHGRLRVSTIHSMLYIPETNEQGAIVNWIPRTAPPEDVDLIIVDEASMVHEDTLNDLLVLGLPILLCGDPGQLPPVKCDEGIIENPDWLLTEVHRQAMDNPIIRLAHSIRLGERFRYDGSDPRLQFRRRGEESFFMTDNIKRPEDCDDNVMICGFNKTRQVLNRTFRKVLRFSGAPRPGDTLICLKNFSVDGAPISNGDRARVLRCEPDMEFYYDMDLDFMDHGFAVEGTIINQQQFGMAGTISSFSGLDCGANSWGQVGQLFDYGYVMTCHKAQGSGFQRVGLVPERFPKSTDSAHAKWLYTGVTRAIEHLSVFGRI